MLLQNSTQDMHGLINMLNCANAAEKIGTDNSVESFKIKSVHMQFSILLQNQKWTLCSVHMQFSI